ncbi:MazG nucleotide pyrophosphohydrolase domain-containing protein [Ferroglobus sp.]|uniref:MazG nucleotide pyrophosphohydrolase domain-containing protein n=1 Tax=Ferroglobus sp. TaxID=2614230 RepID=UPI0025C25943|nr:MazG nucleotide pyrophosphohydrolase domain-containing protein [Ferroglobus sp.]
MELEEIREKIAEKYLEIDKKSGELFLLAVLFEEVGELAEAVRKRDREAVEEELCDVLFMVLSLANYFDVKPENVLVKKYVESDPSSRWDLP